MLAILSFWIRWSILISEVTLNPSLLGRLSTSLRLLVCVDVLITLLVNGLYPTMPSEYTFLSERRFQGHQTVGTQEAKYSSAVMLQVFLLI
jgi:hypothetical protein